MFDANMRHLPKGHRFLADVWGLKEDTILFKSGVRRHSYILCTMMDESEENPRVTVHLESGDIVVDSHSEGIFAYHILYMGTVNDDGSLSDFNQANDLSRAERFMRERFKISDDDSEPVKRIKAMLKAFECGKLKDITGARSSHDFSDIPDDVTVYCGDNRYLK